MSTFDAFCDEGSPDESLNDEVRHLDGLIGVYPQRARHVLTDLSSLSDDAEAQVAPAVGIGANELAGITLGDAARLYSDRLGWRVVPMRPGKKPAVKWKPYQHMPPSHRERDDWFRRPGLTGLAVVNGPASGGLACRDFDGPDAYERWASAHAKWAALLPTVRTSRGFHVYFVCGEPRKTCPFTDGELRFSGLNVLPPSTHDDGTVYSWRIPPTVENLLRVDDVFRAGFVGRATERTQSTERPEKTKSIERTERMNEINGSEARRTQHSPPAPLPLTEELLVAVRACLPEGHGQRHRRLFDLARRLKSLPHLKPGDPRQLRAVVKDWHRLALPHIRTQAFEESWGDFLLAWPRVRYDLNDSPLRAALQRAEACGPPAEVADYDDHRTRLLASICRELQREAGEGPFYLSCRTAGELLGVDHATANRWLNFLTRDGLLDEVEKGSRSGTNGRASRYRYQGSDCAFPLRTSQPSAGPE